MVEIKKLYQNIEKATKELSNFEVDRKYIGLSQFYKCPRLLVKEYYQRLKSDIEVDYKNYRQSFNGYTFEKRMKDRLFQVYRNDYQADSIISLIPEEYNEIGNSLIMGYTDGVLKNESLIEIYTVPSDKFLPKNVREISKRKFSQMQAYMTFCDYDNTIAICESRESGNFKIFVVNQLTRISKIMQDKANVIFEAVSRKELPKCWCKRCE